MNLEYFIVPAASYLIGSIPFGYLIGRLHGIDIRKVGSGNIGATNVTRSIGKIAGKICFFLDFLKGALPVVLVNMTFEENTANLALAAGLAVILGHVFPVYLRFGGGKGVAGPGGEPVIYTILNLTKDHDDYLEPEPEARAAPLPPDISALPMKRGITTNRNKFVLGPSGSGKSFFMNHLVRQYYEQGAHVVLVDTGNSYQGLCEMIRRKTGGTDGVYFTYTEEKPISFNPFYTDDYVFDVEKKDSIKTLLLTLWKSEDDKVTKTESGELGSAVSAYIERIRADRSIVPSFNTFYEYMRDDYRRELAERDIKVEKEDFNIDNMLTTMRQYYRGGRYDFLLNSAENIDLLGKRFIVFEIDSIKDNRELFPVVTIIIMEAFINKMRRLKGVRKQLIVEEAWKALSSANMADYLRYMYKTVRKYFGEAIVVTQEVDDIISSPVVKESIINNSDCKILLDQRKYMNKFDQIQALLGLTEKEKSQILSINMANNPSRLYKEVWIGLGGTQSAVYATEVSAEEYLAYTTEETEKVEVYRLAEQLGGDIEAAIRQLAERRRNKNNQ